MSRVNFLGKLLNRRMAVPLIALLVIILSGAVVFYFSNNSSELNLNFGSNETDPTKEAEAIVAEVEKIYLLPDEVPTLATVSDKNLLADQVFFKRAQNGDKVLIYQTAGLAILYRPAIGKIINVGPVSLDEGQIQSVSAEENLEEASVTILNGTSTVGLTAGAAEDIESIEFVRILDRDDAVNKPYDNTLVIYQSEEFQPQAEIIAASFSAQVLDSLPEEESTSEANIILILGEDYVSQN